MLSISKLGVSEGTDLNENGISRESIVFHILFQPKLCDIHCVKSVQIRSFFWSVFPRIRTEYEYLSVFSPNAGKHGPKKTPYLDTFHAAIAT